MVKNGASATALVPIRDSHVPSPARFARLQFSAGFLTQLIAVAQNADAYRMKRRSDPAIAIAAYARAKLL